MKYKHVTYTILITALPNGTYRAVAPALEGISAVAHTSTDAQVRVEDQLRAYAAEQVAKRQQIQGDNLSVRFVRIDPEECLV